MSDQPKSFLDRVLDSWFSPFERLTAALEGRPIPPRPHRSLGYWLMMGMVAAALALFLLGDVLIKFAGRQTP